MSAGSRSIAAAKREDRFENSVMGWPECVAHQTLGVPPSNDGSVAGSQSQQGSSRPSCRSLGRGPY
eukprot:CAMPEP_0196665280 /NCGR_PEP_ID=MMETSP1086-20130531/60267_1 /TAXON_ID=77921 /ORGANISM="Cyanoptyche  gloeocystis , Strain SAG4.97" /LENGTH=65 /DNA_ID=CAMNT_0042001931 /DNA_START=832 /DNA_END=1029 /DNA_ORIENTATION=+